MPDIFDFDEFNDFDKSVRPNSLTLSSHLKQAEIVDKYNHGLVCCANIRKCQNEQTKYLKMNNDSPSRKRLTQYVNNVSLTFGMWSDRI